MIPKQINYIKLEDINELIENRVAENKTLEYKLELPKFDDSGKKEFLADVSSFANSEGGDIIYGIKEKDSIPISINEISVENIDDLKLRLSSLIRDGIRPRIEYEIKFIESVNNYIIIIRIKNSWNKPHQIIFKNSSKFFTRPSSHKHQMDLDELRNAFLLANTFNEKAKMFHHNRKDEIIYGYPQIPIVKGPKIIMHMIPLSSLTNNSIINIFQNNQDLYLVGNLGNKNKINVDGKINYFLESSSVKAITYSQLYRNGIIEVVDTTILEPETMTQTEKGIPSIFFEQEIEKAIIRFINLYKILEIHPPVFIFLTLLNIKDFVLHRSDHQIFPHKKIMYNRDNLIFPNLVLSDYGKPISSVLKPLFDILWNAFGFEKSFSYMSEE